MSATLQTIDTEERMMLGTDLSADDTRYVLSAFVHRYTRNHIPAWAHTTRREDGSFYPVQFASDADWLAHTRFAVTKAGRLDRRAHHCESTPTWPKLKL